MKIQTRSCVALLLLSYCIQRAAAGRTARTSAGTSGNGDFDQSADDVLLYVHNRLAAAGKEEGRLRERLEQAEVHDEDLSQRLADSQRAAKEAEQRARKALAQKTHEDAIVLVRERRREHLLEVRLSNVTRAFALRGRGLAAARDSLIKARRERARLLSALGGARSNSSALATRLSEASDGLAQFRQKLVKSQQDSETAKHAWHTAEAQLKKTQAVEQREREAYKKAFQKEVQKVKRLQEVDSQKDLQLRDLKREMAKSAAAAEAKFAIERSQEEESQKHLEDERKTQEQQANLLTQALKAYEKRLGEERQQEHQLSKRVASLEERRRQREANATKAASLEEQRRRRLLSERSRLEGELRGNATRLTRLQAEVAQLRGRLQEAEAGRKKAEGAEKSAEEAAERAQAVARQLAGTVPRLLEQAQQAHEAREEEKALRTRTQVTARRQLRQLQRQYASAVKGELEQMGSPFTGPEPNATSVRELPLVQQADDPPPIAAADPAGEVAVPDDESKSSRPADLARDSLGLGSLLSEGGA